MRIRNLSWAQLVLLLIGVGFSGWVLYGELSTKFWLQLCFYGFLMFFIGWVMSIYVLKLTDQRRKSILQKRLLEVLSIGAVVSAVDFGLSACNFYNRRFCAPTCRVGLVNPFTSPCFYGAVIFLVSLWVAVKLYKRLKKAQ